MDIIGNSAAVTSREAEIKLFNVAKASSDELLADYEDYRRVKGLSIWSEEKAGKVREQGDINIMRIPRLKFPNFSILP